MAFDASIIIVSYNRKSVLARCLQCLAAQDYPADRFEIIVVDDGSTDGTAERIGAMTFSCAFRVITHPARRGAGAARNTGIAAALGEIIVFIDSDVFVPPQFLAEHVAAHRAHPRAIVDGPAINVHHAGALEQPPFDAPAVRMQAALDWFGASFITANTSAPRAELKAVGGFDEEFGDCYGWEDVELGSRLRAAGLRTVRNRRAYGLHYKAGKPSLADRARVRRELGENAVLCYIKHPTRAMRRRIRYRYLAYDRLLTRFGFARRVLTVQYVTANATWLWKAVLRRLLLMHAYAEGLQRGFARHCPNHLPGHE